MSFVIRFALFFEIIRVGVINTMNCSTRTILCLVFGAFLLPFAVNADTALSGTLSSSQTLSASSSPYIIAGTVTVPADTTLTIEPGVIIKSSPSGALLVYGNLFVNGNSYNPAYFTSLGDDTIGGDTGNDGTTTPQGWGGLAFYSGSTAVIHNLEMRYGKSPFEIKF